MRTISSAFAGPDVATASPTSAETKASKSLKNGGVEGWWNGPTVTGDWFGQGAQLRKHGIFIQSELTQYGQGLASGDGPKDWEYGGKLDTFVHLEGQMMGTWKGLSLDAHMEFVYGRNVNGNGGMFLPDNTALLLPASNQELVTLSSLFVTQKFLDDYVALSVGRFNTVDFGALSPFDGGRGVTSFWNSAFVVPTLLARTLPPVTNGAVIKVDTKQNVELTLSFLDPQDATTTTGFDNFFDELTILGDITFKTNICGLTGRQQLTGTYSTLEATSLSSLRQLLLPRLLGPAETKQGSWALNYHFDQYLYQPSKESPTTGLGIFGSAGVSDGNPNPIKWTATFGVAGNGIVPCRPKDRFGIAYYYLALSDDLRSGPVLKNLLREDEQGVEMFYTVGLNNWWEITADLQVVDPATTANSTDVVLGMSTRLKF